jgi:hypothetical protein
VLSTDCCDDDCDYIAIATPGPPGVPGDPGPAGPPGSGSEYLAIAATAGADLSGHRAVYRRPDGLIDYASAGDLDQLTTAIWITTGAAVSGDDITMVELGELTESSWAWMPGSPIFLGLSGLLTQTAPATPGSAFSAVLGYAPTSTTMYVDRQPSIVLV